MADRTHWPALVLRAGRVLTPQDEEAVMALLDDFEPTAVQDLTELPLPPGGLWDPTYPPPPDPPPVPLHWRVFFGGDDQRRDAMRALLAAHPDLAVASEDVADEDWAARSQRELTAVHAGRFVVAPPWDVPTSTDATVIVIEPSRGFGTGHHASTRLCLRALSRLDVRGLRVLDLGTGSGVLAMAAALSGARDVLAVDVDPDAIDAARESAALNRRVDGIHWLVGDFRDQGWDVMAGGPWPVVLANLTGGMLTQSAERIMALVAPGGRLVMSGFDENERAEVRRAFHLLDDAAADVEDGWVSLTLERR